MEKRFLTLGVILLLITGIFLINGCAGGGEGSKETGPTSPTSSTKAQTGEEQETQPIKVKYKIMVRERSPYMRVTVSGPEKRYDVQLSGPDKQTINEKIIQKNDMADGAQPVYFWITRPYPEDNPRVGEYTVIVEESSSGKTVFEDTPEYEGWKLNITNASFGPSYHSGPIDKVTLQVKNSGDLPAFTNQITTIIEGVGSWDQGLEGEPIPLPHGRTTEIEEGFPWPSEEGVYLVTLKLYSWKGGETISHSTKVKLASYSTKVEVEKK